MIIVDKLEKFGETKVTILRVEVKDEGFDQTMQIKVLIEQPNRKITRELWYQLDEDDSSTPKILQHLRETQNKGCILLVQSLTI